MFKSLIATQQSIERVQIGHGEEKHGNFKFQKGLRHVLGVYRTKNSASSKSKCECVNWQIETRERHLTG